MAVQTRHGSVTKRQKIDLDEYEKVKNCPLIDTKRAKLTEVVRNGYKSTIYFTDAPAEWNWMTIEMSKIMS